MAKRYVLLIHGVGGTELGHMRRSAEQQARELGISPAELNEFHWNSLVNKPSLFEHKEYMTGLARGFVGSVLLDDVPWAASAARIAILYLIAAVPFLTLWWISLADSWSWERLPLGWRPLIILPRMLDFVPDVLFGSLLDHSANACRLSTRVWGASLVSLSLVYLLGCMTKGSSYIPAAIRGLSVALTWPIVGVMSAIVLWPLGIAAPYLVFLGVATVTTTDSRNGDTTTILPFQFNMSNLLPALLTLAAVVALLWLFYQAYQRSLGPILKVLADIFCYVGDPLYRARIQGALEKNLETLGNLDGVDMYLVGHSLGSVIAVHGLFRHHAMFQPARSVNLITFGSPLYRFFARFFHQAIPGPDELSWALAGCYENFRWLNAYRPLDPIGTRLFHHPHWSAIDQSSRQFGKVLLAAHADYWSDPCIAGYVKAVLGTSATKSDGLMKPEVEMPRVFEGAGERRLPPSFAVVVRRLVMFVPAFLIFVNYLFAGPYFDVHDYRDIVRIVDKQPVDVEAQVQQYTVRRPNGNTGQENAHTHYYVTFPDPICKRDESTPYGSAVDGICNERVSDEMAYVIQKRPWGIPNLRYQRGDPSNFYIPDYEPSVPGPIGLFFRAMGCGVLALAWFWASKLLVSALYFMFGDLESL